MLVQKGADVNVAIAGDGTALQEASARGYYINLVKVLLDKGANVNIKRGNYGTALHAAIYENRVEVAILLVGRGADVNIGGGYYGTQPALQEASARGYLNLAKVILDKGANINIKGGNYGTAPQAAINGNQVEVARLLRGRGAL